MTDEVKEVTMTAEQLQEIDETIYNITMEFEKIGKRIHVLINSLRDFRSNFEKTLAHDIFNDPEILSWRKLNVILLVICLIIWSDSC